MNETMMNDDENRHRDGGMEMSLLDSTHAVLQPIVWVCLSLNAHVMLCNMKTREKKKKNESASKRDLLQRTFMVSRWGEALCVHFSLLKKKERERCILLEPMPCP